MIQKSVRIGNHEGLHLRPAGAACEKAQNFASRIVICFEGREYNVKSVISLLSARISMPREVQLVCEGPDEEQAAEEMEKLLLQI